MHYKNHAKRSQEEKMHRMTGGAVHKKHKHSDEKEDKHLVHEMVKPSALKHRAAGGPVEGDTAKPRMDHGHKSKGGKKHGTHVNILVNPKLHAPGAGGGMDMPPDAGGAPLPPPPGLGGGAGGPPLPPPGGAPMGAPMPMRARGGGVHGHYDAGACSGEGRLEKIANYGKNAKPTKAHD